MSATELAETLGMLVEALNAWRVAYRVTAGRVGIWRMERVA